MSNYDALKAYGFSPAKAFEIIIDAKRGVRHAIFMISLVRAALKQEVGK